MPIFIAYSKGEEKEWKDSEYQTELTRSLLVSKDNKDGRPESIKVSNGWPVIFSDIMGCNLLILSSSMTQY